MAPSIAEPPWEGVHQTADTMGNGMDSHTGDLWIEDSSVGLKIFDELNMFTKHVSIDSL